MENDRALRQIEFGVFPSEKFNELLPLLNEPLNCKLMLMQIYSKIGDVFNTETVGFPDIELNGIIYNLASPRYLLSNLNTSIFCISPLKSPPKINYIGTVSLSSQVWRDDKRLHPEGIMSFPSQMKIDKKHFNKIISALGYEVIRTDRKSVKLNSESTTIKIGSPINSENNIVEIGQFSDNNTFFEYSSFFNIQGNFKISNKVELKDSIAAYYFILLGFLESYHNVNIETDNKNGLSIHCL